MAADVKHIKAQIDISAAKANAELNKLANKLERISASISEINSKGLNEFTGSIERMGQSMQALGKIDMSNFTRFADSMQRLSGLDLAGIQELSNSLTGTSGVSEDVNEITGAVGGLEAGLAALTGVWDIVTKLSDLGKTLKSTKDGLSTLFSDEWMPASLSGGLDEIFGPLKANMDSFVSSVSLGTTSIGEAFTAAFGVSIGSLIGTAIAIAAVVLAIVDLWNTSEEFRDTVSSVFSMLKETLSNAFQEIGDALGSLWESIKGLGTALYDLYESSGLKGLVEILADLAVVLAGIAVTAAIETISNSIVGLIQVAQGAFDILSGLVDVITGIFTLDGEKIIEGFSLMGEGLLEVAEGIVTNALGAVTGTVEAVLSHIPETMRGIGVNIISGLMSGINEEQGTLEKGVGDVCLNLVTGFQDNLDINSPSRVLAEIGNYAVLGLVEPFSDSGNIQEQLYLFAESLINIFRQQLSPENFALIAENALLAFMETFTLGFENMYLVTGESMELLNISVMEALALMSQQIQLIFTNIAMMMLLKWNLMLNQTRLFWLRMNQMVMQSMLLIQTSLFTGMTVVHTGWTAKWVQFVSTVRSACVQVQSAVSALNNSVQSMCSSMLSAIHAVKAAASSMGTVSVRTRPVRGFASGGYPETGELFLARENGMNEMVGRIGNRSAVANNDQIVEAIRGAVVQGINGEGQNALLREQNALLRAILDKDVDVSLDGRSLVDGIDRARRRMGRSFQLA